MEKPDLAIVFEEGLPDEDFIEFTDTISAPGLNVALQSRRNEGPYAGIEWLLPTAIFFFVAKSYFDSFLREAGKDHYHLLKSQLSKTTTKIMKSPRIEPVHVGTKGKLREDNPYSRALSMYAEADDGNTFKLLFPKATYQPDYEQIVASFLNFLDEYHKELTRLEDIGFDTSMRAPGRTIIVQMNEDSKEIEWVDHRQ